MNFAALDIESTGLDASYGRILCVCIKPFDSDEVLSFTARRLRDERRMLTQVSAAYDDIDVVVGWNSKLFDLPFLNARLAYHALPPLPPKKHVDLMYQARKLRFRGARLDGIAKDLRFNHQKIDVPAYRWVMAAEGCKCSQKMILRHCEQDVRMTQEAFARLTPLIQNVTRGAT